MGGLFACLVVAWGVPVGLVVVRCVAVRLIAVGLVVAGPVAVRSVPVGGLAVDRLAVCAGPCAVGLVPVDAGPIAGIAAVPSTVAVAVRRIAAAVGGIPVGGVGVGRVAVCVGRGAVGLVAVGARTIARGRTARVRLVAVPVGLVAVAVGGLVASVGAVPGAEAVGSAVAIAVRRVTVGTESVAVRRVPVRVAVGGVGVAVRSGEGGLACVVAADVAVGVAVACGVTVAGLGLRAVRVAVACRWCPGLVATLGRGGRPGILGRVWRRGWLEAGRLRVALLRTVGGGVLVGFAALCSVSACLRPGHGGAGLRRRRARLLLPGGGVVWKDRSREGGNPGEARRRPRRGGQLARPGTVLPLLLGLLRLLGLLGLRLLLGRGR